jgi:hypothetical protein
VASRLHGNGSFVGHGRQRLGLRFAFGSHYHFVDPTLDLHNSKAFHRRTSLSMRRIVAFAYSVATVNILSGVNAWFHQRALDALVKNDVCGEVQFPIITSCWPLEYECMGRLTSPPQQHIFRQSLN